jgi:hypothetical protein
MTSQYEMVIHDRRDGRAITEIETEYECSWVLDTYGRCTFRMALTDTKARDALILHAGNHIHIQHEALPAWGGVIAGDEDWNEDETISLYSYSAPILLSFRRSPRNQVLKAASGGALYQMLINLANAPEDLLIRAGSQWNGGTPRQDTMDGKDLYTHVESIGKNAGCNWSIDPALDVNGNLFFEANWYEQQGVESALVLEEGHNITKRRSPMKVSTAQLVNDLLGMGDASTNDRPEYNEVDAESRDQYGLRQGTEDFDGNSDPGTLKANVTASLKSRKQPTRLHFIEALNVGKTFNEIRIGNVHPYLAHTYGRLGNGTIGVDTKVRILGMRYKQATDSVDLTVEEFYA